MQRGLKLLDDLAVSSQQGLQIEVLAANIEITRSVRKERPLVLSLEIQRLAVILSRQLMRRPQNEKNTGAITTEFLSSHGNLSAEISG